MVLFSKNIFFHKNYTQSQCYSIKIFIFKVMFTKWGLFVEKNFWKNKCSEKMFGKKFDKKILTNYCRKILCPPKYAAGKSAKFRKENECVLRSYFTHIWNCFIVWQSRWHMTLTYIQKQLHGHWYILLCILLMATQNRYLVSPF